LNKTVDVVFPIKGEKLPWDHSYALFGALSRVQPLIHEGALEMGVFPINGLSRGNRLLELTDRSQLRLRVLTKMIPDLMCFLGTTLELDGHRVRLGNPKIEPIKCTPRLFSPWTTLKEATDPGIFLQRVGEEIERLGVQASYSFVEPKHAASKDGGKGARDSYIRRTRSIKGHAIVGFALIAEGLSLKDSQKLQSQGLGGRRHFGGGLFLPAKGR
jgi:CRISPR-associated protein Cas6